MTGKSDLAGCTQKISGNISPCIPVYSSPDPDKKKELSKEKKRKEQRWGGKEWKRGEDWIERNADKNGFSANEQPDELFYHRLSQQYN